MDVDKAPNLLIQTTQRRYKNYIDNTIECPQQLEKKAIYIYIGDAKPQRRYVFTFLITTLILII